jgi:NAD(P)-dependent dehydrogenase (short-subunit alcohol dehydrogenase family)
MLYAREGADVAFTYLPAEESDAQETRRAVTTQGRRCLAMAGHLEDASFCREAVERTVRELGRLDILVSNAAHQNRKPDVSELSEQEWFRTFDVNIHAYYRLVRASVPHMKPGSAIIVTSSVVAWEGSESLPDYAATKGAINSFTKAVAKQLVERGIRVNAVAPGPVWTPLNPADQGTSPERVSRFGQSVPMGRPAQPEELAPMYVFLASDADSSYITGAIMPVLGGEATP